MGTIKKRKVTIGIILSTAIVYLIIFADYNSFRRDIYFKYHSKINLGYILGYLPKDYKLDYDESIFNSDDKFDLVNIVYNKYPNYHNYIIFHDKVNKDESLLKNNDLYYYKIEGREDLLSFQMDLGCFNRLIGYKEMKNRDSISNYYLSLLSQINLNNYRIISNDDAYKKLLQNYDESFGDEIDTELMVDKNRSLNFNDYKYCWFSDLGFFEIRFSFDGVTLKNVSDTFLGYIGSENW